MAFLAHGLGAYAQVRTITGRVTDAASGDPVPYASVTLVGTRFSAQTDFDGKYTLRLNGPAGTNDSLAAHFLGYYKRTKPLGKAEKQQINFQLEEAVLMGQVVELVLGENPAYEVMRRVVARKEANNPDNLKAYETQTYTRLEVDLDNMSEKFRKRKLVRKVQSLADSIQRMAGEDGKPILPVFVSEGSSHIYHLRERTREEIQHSKVTGFLKEGNIVSQLVGTTFVDYNFYDNNLNILNKFFASPITDSWRIFYEYDLRDSLEIDGEFCYEIGVTPRREQDLAFSGTIWITKNTYALKRLNVRTSKATNINFVEGLRIQQDLQPTGAGPYIVAKSRIVLDVAEVTENTAGMLAKYYVSNQLLSVNEPRPLPFYDRQVERVDGYMDKLADSTWNQLRGEPLTQTEANVYRMIDTVRRLPVVRSYIEIGDVIFNGYKRFGGFELGNFFYTYAVNNVEGHRFRLGGQTNMYFHPRLGLGGYAAYGTLDGQVKYEGRLNYVLDKEKWTMLRLRHTKDIEQVALIDNGVQSNALFYAFTRFGDIKSRRPFFTSASSISLTREVTRGLQLTAGVNRRLFEPLYTFTYRDRQGYFHNNDAFVASEAQFGLRYAPKEILVENRLNDRDAYFSSVSPVLNVTYSHGISGFLGGSYDYSKFSGAYSHTVSWGILGTGRYAFEGGYILSRLPYPLLRMHLGNPTPFYNGLSYNMMGLFEFVSDYYAGATYQHYFEGLLLNSIPYLRKAKLRLVGQAKALYGGMSHGNRVTNLDGNGELPFQVLRRTPYVEVGYGVENIFRFLRIDVFHRLTYLDSPKARPIGVKFSVWFKL